MYTLLEISPYTNNFTKAVGNFFRVSVRKSFTTIISQKQKLEERVKPVEIPI